MSRADITITIKSDSEMNGTRFDFRPGVTLVETRVCDADQTSIRNYIARGTGWLPDRLLVLSRNQILMANKMELHRAQQAALTAFGEATWLFEQTTSDYLDQMFEITDCTIKSARAYHRQFWLLALRKGDCEPTDSFGDLRRAFDSTELQNEVATLLAKVSACTRIWQEGSESILQVFAKS